MDFRGNDQYSMIKKCCGNDVFMCKKRVMLILDFDVDEIFKLLPNELKFKILSYLSITQYLYFKNNELGILSFWTKAFWNFYLKRYKNVCCKINLSKYLRFNPLSIRYQDLILEDNETIFRGNMIVEDGNNMRINGKYELIISNTNLNCNYKIIGEYEENQSVGVQIQYSEDLRFYFKKFINSNGYDIIIIYNLNENFFRIIKNDYHCELILNFSIVGDIFANFPFIINSEKWDDIFENFLADSIKNKNDQILRFISMTYYDEENYFFEESKFYVEKFDTHVHLKIISSSTEDLGIDILHCFINNKFLFSKECNYYGERIPMIISDLEKLDYNLFSCEFL